MTPALHALHTQYPGRFQTDIRTSCDAIFENNPYITKLDGGEEITIKNVLINDSDTRPVHVIQSGVESLSRSLGLKLECAVNHPLLYVSEQEKGWVSQVQEISKKPVKYWVVCSGVKNDYPIKGWGQRNYQSVIDATPFIQWVQVGESGHNHPPLNGVLNLVGKTDARQLIRLVYHAEGGIGGESFLHHLFAAFKKPFVCLASGFLPRSWSAYPSEVWLSRHGQLPCCKEKACWRARVVALPDNDHKNSSLCELPTFTPDPIPRCMAMIRPDEVVDAVMGYYRGGVLRF